MEKQRGFWLSNHFNWRFRPDKEIEHLDFALSADRAKQLQRVIDQYGFNWRVFLVAATGFLATSYSLFSLSFSSPALNYVYPLCGHPVTTTVLDELTLVATLLGSVILGHASDLFGRKRLYGIELVIIIIATSGLVQSGAGFMYPSRGVPLGEHSSMDIYSWIAWWRFLLGFGIGAECPASATIAAEWSSTQARGRMLAGLRSMQSISRLIAFAVGLAAVKTMAEPASSSVDETRVDMDRIWRCIMGVALIPAFIALGFRMTIPETPRYYMDVRGDLPKAIRKAKRVYPSRQLQEADSNAPSSVSSKHGYQADGWYKRMLFYLKHDKMALRNLLLIITLWALSDAGFYGMALDNYTVLASLMRPVGTTKYVKPATACGDDFTWIAALEGEGATIHQLLERSFIRSLQVVGIAAVVGSLVAIAIVQRFRRRNLLISTFLLIAVLFAATGATLWMTTEGDGQHLTSVVLYAIAQIVYNAGPNTIVFVIAAEIFPTTYRGTFYGMANAGGKVGGIIIRAVIGKTGNQPKTLSIRLLIFIPVMLLAAFISFFLPDVQEEPSRRAVDTEKTSAGSSGTSQDISSDDAAGNPSYHEAHTTLTLPAGRSDDEVSETTISSFGDSRRDIHGSCAAEDRKAWSMFGSLRNRPLEEIAPSPTLHQRGAT